MFFREKTVYPASSCTEESEICYRNCDSSSHRKWRRRQLTKVSLIFFCSTVFVRKTFLFAIERFIVLLPVGIWSQWAQAKINKTNIFM